MIAQPIRSLSQPKRLLVATTMLLLVGSALFVVSVMEIIDADTSADPKPGWAEPVNDVGVTLFVASLLGCAGLIWQQGVRSRRGSRSIKNPRASEF